ncbi:MAG: hypothetical protein KatS3mg023_4004 [Armatimonadota bacterium]|nr:MAG: hypothetical protein KatS3mg023_4004 [Armatimonadota bacterium]
MQREDVLTIIRLMRCWEYDPATGIWTHRYQPDISVTSDLLALIVHFSVVVGRELEREVEDTTRRAVYRIMAED